MVSCWRLRRTTCSDTRAPETPVSTPGKVTCWRAHTFLLIAPRKHSTTQPLPIHEPASEQGCSTLADTAPSLIAKQAKTSTRFTQSEQLALVWLPGGFVYVGHGCHVKSRSGTLSDYLRPQKDATYPCVLSLRRPCQPWWPCTPRASRRGGRRR